MRMHPTFIGLVALGSALTMAGCGSSTATTSSATSAAAPTVAQSTTAGTAAAGASTVAGSAPPETAPDTSAAPQTTPQTASPGVTAPRGSIVAAPGRVVPVTDVATTSAVGVDASLQSTIDLAVADLAAQLKVDPSAITTTSAKSVEWPDKSDGCPQPGMSYSQVPVDGVLIVLSVKGSPYEYHSGGSRTPFLCKKG